LWDSLSYRIPSFIGYFVSFLVIALYWKFYLQFSKYIKQYDEKLFWYNIFLLLFVALLPFSTAFFVANINIDHSILFYSGNLIMLSLFNYLMLKVVSKRLQLSVHKKEGRWLRYRAFTTLLVWILAFSLTFVSPWIAKLSFILIFVFQLVGKFYFRKYSK